MIRISQLKIDISHSKEQLESRIIKTLKLNKNENIRYSVVKRSLDARKKPDLFFVYTVDVDIQLSESQIKRLHNPNVSVAKESTYIFPERGTEILSNRPVIVGAGPAGLFSAFILTEMGYKPIVIERGKNVDNRMKDVNKFWETGVLDTESNVQFGEGGAGTFSDGKLNTVVKDPASRNKFVLETFVKFGASEEILYDNKPHIGTDVLCSVIKNIRLYLVSKGCEFRFETCVKDFVFENKKLKKIICNSGEVETDVCVLAIGHSSRDTFITLNNHGIPMEAKQFAVGFRVEHPQSMINYAMYGKESVKGLKASPYKVTSNFPNGRGVYSFCMCPGGVVVNASSMEGHTVVNGMSYSKRDGVNANSAIIVSVGPDDYGHEGPLAGMYYQMDIEKEAYKRANGLIPQQLYGDFRDNKESKVYGSYESTTKGGHALTNLRGIFSQEIEDTFIQGMTHFSKIIPDFDRSDAIMSGIESRTSSPIRINRNEFFESDFKGIYPCGEGAGYAGGITSAAMDGIKVAEAIIRKYDYVG